MFRKLWNWSRGIVWLSVLALVVAVAAVVLAVLGWSLTVVLAVVGLAIVLVLIS